MDSAASTRVVINDFSAVCVVDAFNMCIQVANGVSVASLRLPDVTAVHDLLSLDLSKVDSHTRSGPMQVTFMNDHSPAIPVWPVETGKLPFWDTRLALVVWHSVETVLDYSFYSECGRTPPQSLRV